MKKEKLKIMKKRTDPSPNLRRPMNNEQYAMDEAERRYACEVEVAYEELRQDLQSLCDKAE